MNKMGASCCKSKASKVCTVSVEGATAAKAAADKAFKDAGCDTDATKAGCDTLKVSKEPFNSALMGVNSISPAHPHVRPSGAYV